MSNSIMRDVLAVFERNTRSDWFRTAKYVKWGRFKANVEHIQTKYPGRISTRKAPKSNAQALVTLCTQVALELS